VPAVKSGNGTNSFVIRVGSLVGLFLCFVLSLLPRNTDSKNKLAFHVSVDDFTC
jgi:hypothetical protein